MATSPYTPTYSLSESSYRSVDKRNLSLSFNLLEWQAHHNARLILDCAAMQLIISIKAPPPKDSAHGPTTNATKPKKKPEYEPSFDIHKSPGWHQLYVKSIELNGWKRAGYRPIVLNLEDKVLIIRSDKEADVFESPSLCEQVLSFISEKGGGLWIIDRLMFLLGVFVFVSWCLKYVGLV